MGRARGGRHRRVEQGTCFQPIEYDALASQARFHASTARFKGFSGPIGSGKSQALCQEAVKLGYLNAGRMGLLGAPTYPMLRDATQTTLFEILQRNGIPYEYNKGESTVKLLDTGSKIVLRAVDEFERLRGTNLAWFGLDELTYTPEEAWLRLEGRLRDPRACRLCGFAVWTPKGYDWVFRRFFQKTVEGYEVIIARPFENRHLLEKVPDFYERLRHSYDEKFYEQEVLGEYLNSSGGRVYHAFDRKRGLVESKVNRTLPLLWTLDFNVDPMSSLIVQIVKDSVYVIAEVSLKRASTLEACEHFYERFGDHPAAITIYGDATGARLQTTGKSDHQLIREFFQRQGHRNWHLKIGRSNPAVRERVRLTNQMLCAADGRCRLYVDPKCTELIRDFEEVVYISDSSAVDKDRDPARTHLSDALGYLLWEEFGQKGAGGERQNRLL